MKKKKTIIIAEIGCNHNGKYQLAIKHIDAAIKSGATAVKFQIFDPKNLVAKNTLKAPYALKTTKMFKDQLSMQKKIMFKFDLFLKLKNYCKKKNIDFLCSAFDVDGLDYLNKIGLKTFKIPSGEINNIPYLYQVKNYKKKIILSTGMANLDEINSALKILRKSLPLNKISLLHCVSIYPTDEKNINLKSIQFLKDKFKCNVGLSDHTSSLIVPALAVISGAKIIEKHFTLNKNWQGPDHSISLNPSEFKIMVKNIKTAEVSLGTYQKILTKKELSLKKHARKSIIAKTKINKGELFTKKNLTIKRPGTGIEPKKIFSLIGKKSKKNFKEDDLIKF